MIAPLLAALLMLQTGPETAAPTVTVEGHGRVETPPDHGTLSYRVTGEGTQPDEATRALVERQKAIAGALTGLDADAMVRTGQITLAAARSPECRDDDGPQSARLSTGACAVRGYVATLQVTATMTPAAIGTAAGLAARFGAEQASSDGFALRSAATAQARAVAAAIAAAREQAGAAAQAAGRRLGPVLSIRDQSGEATTDIVVTGSRLNAPPGIVQPPIRVDLAPEPVVTTARLAVTFALLP